MDEKLQEFIKYCKNLHRLGSAKMHVYYDVVVEATNFLPINASVAQRLWHITNMVSHIPTCGVCGVKSVSWRKEKGGFYSKTCSNSCATKDPIRKNKIQNTNLQRYGNTSPLGSKEVQLKARSTVQKRYGVNFVSQTESVKQKVSQTLFKQRNKNHNSYDEVVELINQGKTQQEIGDIIGISQERVSYLLKRFSVKTITPSCTSKPQRDLVAAMEGMGLAVTENDKALIPPMHIDILTNVGVAVEVNGIYWHSELSGKNKTYHLQKYMLCKERGVRLLQFLDIEYIEKPNIVHSVISCACNLSERIWARKTKIVSVLPTDERKFFNDNHMQGYVPSKWCFGLMYEDMLVAVMSFGKSRFGNLYDVELLRYASVCNKSVVGGASKLFKHAVKVIQPSSIISYSDNRWFTGGMYEVLGFAHDGTTPPGYSYFKRNGDTTKTLSRMRFQKHKLKEELGEHIDLNKTEWELMQEAGYDRIWDAGHTRWVWRK